MLGDLEWQLKGWLWRLVNCFKGDNHVKLPFLWNSLHVQVEIKKKNHLRLGCWPFQPYKPKHKVLKMGVYPDKIALNKPSHQDLRCTQFCFGCYQTPLFTIMGLFFFYKTLIGFEALNSFHFKWFSLKTLVKEI